ncbi:hypothetical protein FSU_2345 [Fibrobacter succinogenes subsp. succinogenes S85]|uniref:Uncharacterized protein n=1 Tax=Fibrobacter succinogenes (strain ATCC 19169 / S85) TaxID=59374 RepID=D9S4M3_FIBSS|nr:hypothetical protein FSU_2345 [Fibrobacter succinogenes subsp. succinogenes S85]
MEFDHGFFSFFHYAAMSRRQSYSSPLLINFIMMLFLTFFMLARSHPMRLAASASEYSPERQSSYMTSNLWSTLGSSARLSLMRAMESSFSVSHS